MAFAACGLSACGSSSSKVPSDAVAVVGGTPITRPTLNHWMQSMTGGDYFEHTGKRAPHGLTSDPVNIPSCLAAARSLVAGGGKHAPVSDAKLEGICRQLNRQIREQALSFLISVQWRVNEGAERGLKVSDAEVNRYFRKLSANQFPKPGQLQTYLADHEWALSDELHQLKRNLLTTKLQEKVGSGDPTHKQLAFVKLVTSNVKKRVRETNCRPGYVVSVCRQFKGEPGAATAAPAALLEQLAGM
jgi:hypothetical protein